MSDAVPFVHHLTVVASDFDASERIFTAALGALGIEALHRADGVAEYWRPQEDRLSFSVERARVTTSVTHRMHIAFASPDRVGVDRFHAAAVEAGATSRHEPRFWSEYRA